MPQRLPECSVSMLCDWYNEFCEVITTRYFSMISRVTFFQEREDRATVVFVLESLEEFPVSILTDLVSVLRLVKCTNVGMYQL